MGGGVAVVEREAQVGGGVGRAVVFGEVGAFCGVVVLGGGIVHVVVRELEEVHLDGAQHGGGGGEGEGAGQGAPEGVGGEAHDEGQGLRGGGGGGEVEAARGEEQAGAVGGGAVGEVEVPGVGADEAEGVGGLVGIPADFAVVRGAEGEAVEVGFAVAVATAQEQEADEGGEEEQAVHGRRKVGEVGQRWAAPTAAGWGVRSGSRGRHAARRRGRGRRDMLRPPPTRRAPRGGYAVRRRTAVRAGIRVWPPGCR